MTGERCIRTTAITFGPELEVPLVCHRPMPHERIDCVMQKADWSGDLPPTIAERQAAAVAARTSSNEGAP